MSKARHIRSDYLSGAEALKPFYQYPPQGPDFEQIIADKAFPDHHRQALVEVLRDQYADLPAHGAVQDNIAALADPQTYTVTTGHQLGLMGGPLFTIYKVMTIVKLAEQLSEQLDGKRVIPLFWIHTEDHDFEEINHFYTSFYDRQVYHGDFKGAVGEHVLGESIKDLIPANFSEELAESWAPGYSLTQAFRKCYHTLLKSYGVVMLDAADPRLKGLFREVLTAEIHEHAAFDAVQHTSVALEAAGYKIQIHPREINLFYLDHLGRNRLVPENGHVKVLDRDIVWSETEIDTLIDRRPEQFSPNVSLRPLYQEMILPNLAYIGGWGELSYWVQLKDVFRRFKTNFPLLLPRFSATVMTKAQAIAWQEMGFELEDIRKPLHELNDQHMPYVWSDEVYEEKVAHILAELEALRIYVEEDVSHTLARSVDALKTKSQRYLGNVHKKAYRVKRHQHAAPFLNLAEIKAQVQPDGMVQERIWSLGALPLQPDEFVKVVAAACNPLDFTHKILVVEAGK